MATRTPAWTGTRSSARAQRRHSRWGPPPSTRTHLELSDLLGPPGPLPCPQEVFAGGPESGGGRGQVDQAPNVAPDRHEPAPVEPTSRCGRVVGATRGTGGRPSPRGPTRDRRPPAAHPGPVRRRQGALQRLVHPGRPRRAARGGRNRAAECDRPRGRPRAGRGGGLPAGHAGPVPDRDRRRPPRRRAAQPDPGFLAVPAGL